jgi:nitric oxide reductase subunit B
LTLNHGHAALLGAFGMLAMALVVLGLRHVLTDEQWAKPEKFIKVRRPRFSWTRNYGKRP